MYTEMAFLVFLPFRRCQCIRAVFLFFSSAAYFTSSFLFFLVVSYYSYFVLYISYNKYTLIAIVRILEQVFFSFCSSWLRFLTIRCDTLKTNTKRKLIKSMTRTFETENRLSSFYTILYTSPSKHENKHQRKTNRQRHPSSNIDVLMIFVDFGRLVDCHTVFQAFSSRIIYLNFEMTENGIGSI